MKHIATAPPACYSRRRRRRSLAAYGFPYPPTARTIPRQGTTRNDACPYNNGSELMSGVVDGTGLNGWDYDNIGNRRMEHRSDGYEIYTANRLNQYTAIEDAEGTFTPTYDADGNQTRVKTSTGIWNVTYNAKNRPILFTKDDNSVSVECAYDYMGRRATKKVTTNGTVTLHQRYLYRGYLQIACCDLLRSNEPCLWLITWDPTQPIATRPLAIQKDGTWYTYGWDLTKNVWEVYGTTGYIGTAYTYTAYGQVTASGAVEQPIQWSSEYNDTELGFVYFNYRYYDPGYGWWIGRDFFQGGNLYCFVHDNPCSLSDRLGLVAPGIEVYEVIKQWNSIHETETFKNAIFHEINSAIDALMYYKSRRGGTMLAGPKLIGKILKSSGHQNNLKELKIKLKNKLLENCGYEMCTQSRGSWHNRGGVIGFYTDNNALGHVDFTVHPYPVNWTATKIRQSSNKENINVLVSFTAIRELSFTDNYVFDSISNFKQIFTDFIPWIIAGEGEPFRITGKFTDSVSSEFIFSCPCNID